MLLGVEAPAVSPMVIGPAGSQPVVTTSATAAVEGPRSAGAESPCRTARQAVPAMWNVGHPLGANPRQVTRIAAVVAANHHGQGQRVRVEQREHGILPFLGRAADGVECAEPRRQLAVEPYRSSIACLNISPISSDSLISIVVWFAQPTRARCCTGSNPADTAFAETRNKRGSVAAVADEITRQLRPLHGRARSR